jgi:starch-binding outer membrane protein, SusD/RagB family
MLLHLWEVFKSVFNKLNLIKIMKNKSLIYTWLLTVGLCLNSCSDNILDQVNNNTVSSGTFWRNADDIEKAVNGMYHPMTNTYFFGRIIHTGVLLRSDEFNIRPAAGNTAMATLQGGPGTARWSEEIWSEPFKTIYRANAVIENTNATNISDEKRRNGLVGQAYFLRGLANWYLLNIFGNIPLITKTPKTTEEFFPSQATKEAVWTQIVADFDQAEKMLPASWDGTNKGRPTSGSAAGMKGKSYLYQGKWAEAETAFKKVVVSGKYGLLPANRYAENFSETNENNEESVFELQFLGIQAFSWGVDIPGVGTMGNYHIDYAPPTKSPDQSHYLNSWLKTLFEANGETIRREQTLAYEYEGSKGYGGVDFKKDFAGDVAKAVADKVEPIFTKKYAGLDIGTRDKVDFLGTNVGNNWRIMRYADVLLMLAESLNEQGKTTEAEVLLNQVRSRAGVKTKTGLIKETMKQAIIDERALELTGEGHRFFDLVRWNLAETYMGANSKHGKNPKSLSGGTFQKNKHELVWIPQSELQANKNLKQNPGY